MNEVTHITGQGTADAGYSIRIHRAGRDVIQRRDQLEALTEGQRTIVARRLKGLGGKSLPKVDSAAVWRALDALEAFQSDPTALVMTAGLDPEELRARSFAAVLNAVGRDGLAAAPAAWAPKAVA
ncbi:hypothetical protein [Gordonia alkaliphila]|uniref:Uncharacterized protein n=1 Tax=Gordonia alkaliphila TaxID=1053547 RepID=A0ABP8YY23_9ACTN